MQYSTQVRVAGLHQWPLRVVSMQVLHLKGKYHHVYVNLCQQLGELSDCNSNVCVLYVWGRRQTKKIVGKKSMCLCVHARECLCVCLYMHVYLCACLCVCVCVCVPERGENERTSQEQRDVRHMAQQAEFVPVVVVKAQKRRAVHVPYGAVAQSWPLCAPECSVNVKMNAGACNRRRQAQGPLCVSKRAEASKNRT